MDDDIYIPKQLQFCRFIKTNDKMPIEKEWNTYNNYNYEDMSEYIKNKKTYGVVCGFKNLLVIDFDDAEFQNKIISKYDIFNKTFAVKSANKQLGHYYFFVEKVPESFKGLDADGKTIFDAQGISKQVIGANSILSNGKKYEILQNNEILHVEYTLIKNILLQQEDDNTKKENVIDDISTNSDITKKIKEKLKISAFLKSIGIDSSKNLTCCPLHSSVNGKCLSFDDSKALWNCFHCNKGGDVISLYMLVNQCDFTTAIKDLCTKLNIRKNTSNKKYSELKISQFVIMKNDEETSYIIKINDIYDIRLSSDEILNCNGFRKKFFNETGELLPPLNSIDWMHIINLWSKECGTINCEHQDDNTNKFIINTVINTIMNSIVVVEKEQSLNFGRVLFDDGTFYICIKCIEDILIRNNFKMKIGELRYLLRNVTKGQSKVIRIEKNTHRFWVLNNDFFKFEVIKNDKKQDD